MSSRLIDFVKFLHLNYFKFLFIQIFNVYLLYEMKRKILTILFIYLFIYNELILSSLIICSITSSAISLTNLSSSSLILSTFCDEEVTRSCWVMVLAGSMTSRVFRTSSISSNVILRCTGVAMMLDSAVASLSS